MKLGNPLTIESFPLLPYMTTQYITYIAEGRCVVQVVV